MTTPLSDYEIDRHHRKLSDVAERDDLHTIWMGAFVLVEASATAGVRRLPRGGMSRTPVSHTHRRFGWFLGVSSPFGFFVFCRAFRKDGVRLKVIWTDEFAF